EGAFEVLARAKALEKHGMRVVHLEIGEPDFPTPDNIIEAAIGALRSDYTHYTPAGGIGEVRETVAGFVSKRLGVEVEPGEVVLVPGSKNVLLFTLLACVEPGDEVILPDPGYPVYSSLVSFIEAKPVPIRLREDRGFRMDLGELAASMETLMINSSSCAAAFTQMAAIEALTSPESERAVGRMVAEFRSRRDIMVDGLNAIPGVSCVKPEGAFYAFPNISQTGLD